MGPGGEKTNPQQQPGTYFWFQPSQANRPAVRAIDGTVAEPVIPPPTTWQAQTQIEEQHQPKK